MGLCVACDARYKLDKLLMSRKACCSTPSVDVIVTIIFPYPMKSRKGSSYNVFLEALRSFPASSASCACDGPVARSDL